MPPPSPPQERKKQTVQEIRNSKATAEKRTHR